jgi:hypothetical protein
VPFVSGKKEREKKTLFSSLLGFWNYCCNRSHLIWWLSETMYVHGYNVCIHTYIYNEHIYLPKHTTIIVNGLGYINFEKKTH